MSDRLTAAACVAAIVAVGLWYSHTVLSRDTGWRQYLADPPAHDGALAVFPTHTVTAIEGPSRYTIGGVIRDIPVEGDATALQVGDRISVRGSFRAADQVVVEERHLVHRLWAWKERLGILGLVLSVLAAPLAFTLRDGWVVERG